MRFLSLRARVTLWNTAVLALTLTLLGFALRYSVQAHLMASLDRDLRERSRITPVGVVLPGPDGPPLPRPGPPLAPNPVPAPLFLQRAPHLPHLLPPKLLDRSGREYLTGAPATPWDPQTFPLSLRGETLYSTTIHQGTEMRAVSRPLRLRGRIVGVVQAATPLTETRRAIRGVTHTLLLLTPLALVLSCIGGASLTRRALGPVRDMTEAAERIRAQNLSQRLPVAGSDEFSLLAVTFNAMLARLENDFERQRRFTADASHELRTPIAIIKAAASLALEERGSAEEYQEALEEINRAADRSSRIVQDLLLLARSDSCELVLSRDCVAIRDVLRDAAGAVGNAPCPSITFDAPDPSLCVLGDAHHLARVFANLLENACRHTPDGGNHPIHTS